MSTTSRPSADASPPQTTIPADFPQSGPLPALQRAGGNDCQMGLLVDVALAAAAVLLPVECSGCGRPDYAVCSACVLDLAGDVPLRRTVGTGHAALDVYSGITYAGAAQHILPAFKEKGRTDAAHSLAVPLAAAIRASVVAFATDWASADRVSADRVSADSASTDSARVDERRAVSSGSPSAGGSIGLVCIPSSRAAQRRRGYEPVGLTLRAAGVRPLPRVIRMVRQPSDQVGLDREQRAANLLGSMRASPSVAGRCILLIDDVVTTGSTLLEAARALRAEGADVLGAATIATAVLRAPLRGLGATRRDIASDFEGREA